MTTVEYEIGLEERVFGELTIEQSMQNNFNNASSHEQTNHSTCKTGCSECGGFCTGCVRLSTKKIDINSARPTLQKIANTTPSLLEMYVANVGAENVEPRYASLLTKLEELDLDPIKVKLMDAEEGYGWTREQADSAATAYKQFLFINAKYEDASIVPTKLVDKVWHYHILDTMKYAEDSQEIFGSFFHHFPYFGMRGEEDAANLKSSFEETQDLFVKEFGAPQLVGFEGKAETYNNILSYCKSSPSCGSSKCKSSTCDGPGRCKSRCKPPSNLD